MAAVLDGAKNEFASKFLNYGIGDLKKDFAGKMPEFYFKLRAFSCAFLPVVQALDAEQQRLYRMYRAGKGK